MNAPLPYALQADVVLSLHVALVVFIVGGLALVIAGNLCGWRWVNALWLRGTHLAAIAVVATEAWLGAACPLTTLEMQLRANAHVPTYAGSFVQHWLQRMLYYDAPAWVFTLGYTLFGLAVVAAWWYFPPTYRRHARGLRLRRRSGRLRN